MAPSVEVIVGQLNNCIRRTFTEYLVLIVVGGENACPFSLLLAQQVQYLKSTLVNFLAQQLRCLLSPRPRRA